MPGQGRLGDRASTPLDSHGCPACPHPALGPAIQGSPDVNVNRRPALRVDDPGIHAACCGANTWTATQGSATVFINGKSAHRMGDANRHCGGMGRLIEGSPNVVVGDSGGAGVATGRDAATATQRMPGTAAASAGSPLPASQRPAAASAAGTSVARQPGDAAGPPSPASRSIAADRWSFLELELLDRDGEPLPFTRFTVTAPDGTLVAGELDARGRARIDGLPEGRCQVAFPDLHGDDWSEAP